VLETENFIKNESASTIHSTFKTMMMISSNRSKMK